MDAYSKKKKKKKRNIDVKYPQCRKKSREIYSRMYFQEKSPYTKDRPHEREGRESRDKQYPFLYI